MTHPKPETIGEYKVVYPIFREDLAEAILIKQKGERSNEEKDSTKWQAFQAW